MNKLINGVPTSGPNSRTNRVIQYKFPESEPIFWGHDQRIAEDRQYVDAANWFNNETLVTPKIVRFIHDASIVTPEGDTPWRLLSSLCSINLSHYFLPDPPPGWFYVQPDPYIGVYIFRWLSYDFVSTNNPTITRYIKDLFDHTAIGFEGPIQWDYSSAIYITTFGWTRRFDSVNQYINTNTGITNGCLSSPRCPQDYPQGATCQP